VPRFRHVFHLSPDAAKKRIQKARARGLLPPARRAPAAEMGLADCRTLVRWRDPVVTELQD